MQHAVGVQQYAGTGRLQRTQIGARGRAAKRVIRQNLFVSLGVVLLLIPAILFGWAGIGMAVAIHEGLTFVAINALRLLAYDEESGGPRRPEGRPIVT
ncbi:MAG: hypothetical protein AMXMBFR6_04300 [Betaproteobacteria bacterium]